MGKKYPLPKKPVYYAVLAGEYTGVYDKREDFCDKIKDMKGVKIRKWDTYSEARACIRRPELFTMSASDIRAKNQFLKFAQNNCSTYAYVDGSFNNSKNVYGYGGFIDVNGARHVISGSGNDERYLDLGIAAGEILGVMAVFDKVSELNLDEIIIHHDAMIVQQWLSPECKNRSELRQEYYEKAKALTQNGVDLKFQHVKAHVALNKSASYSNTFAQNKGMRIADRLAKEAVGTLSYRPLPISFFNVKTSYAEPEFDLYEPDIM